jgi:hypothetical protein
MRRFLLLALVFGAACGKSTPAPQQPPPAGDAQGLDYQDPTSSGWRLVKDAGSTPERLLLSLVGPAGLKTRGAAFNVQLPASVRAGGFPELGYESRPEHQLMPVRTTGVYELRRCTECTKGACAAGQTCDAALNVCRSPTGCFQNEAGRDPLEPVLLAGGLKPGNLLTAGAFQKDRRADAKDSGVPLLQIAIELDGSAGLSSGDVLPLAITRARYMADDIGAFSVVPTAEQIAKATLVDMTIDVGVLRAQ